MYNSFGEVKIHEREDFSNELFILKSLIFFTSVQKKKKSNKPAITKKSLLSTECPYISL